MKSKIYRLPEAVINQIAAGEVVENPASIVKELVENSLDAGAKTIAIEIVDGGQQLIRIEDDGWGMNEEDALLCLERHATSKIRKTDDLQLLATMGFRGEALAAIASVSQFELKTSEGSVGTRVVAEGGAIALKEPCARNRGTTIDVRSLFYNVPARKKFQKSAAANSSQVARTLETIALAHPGIAFSLVQQGKKTVDLKAANWKERIEEILGEHEHEVHFTKNEMTLTGLIGAPAKAMATRVGQYLFINQRPIFSPLIAKAVKEGFGTRIGANSYPIFVLFLNLPPHLVDINVHPQKKEARFQDESALFRFVQEAIAKAFTQPHFFVEPLSFPPPFSFAEKSAPLSFVAGEERAEELPLVFSDKPLAVRGHYLLVEREALLLVDLQAAHARVLFESIQVEKGGSQALLWPLQVELRPGDEELVGALNEVGIECRLLGQKTLVVDALPPFLEAIHFPLFLETWKEKKKLDQIAPYFCRKIKKGYALAEAMVLWRRLQQCKDQLYDPAGQRIWKEITENHLQDVLK